VPIFNWNQGGIARAEAEFERAERQSATLRNQIGLDIRLAATRVRQATSESAFLKNSVRPEVEAAVHRAEKSYENGSASYLIVLETTRQLLDMATREAQLRADLRRAVAELERSVGRRLATPKAPTP
jgi:cobalt-zinc-cadmium efflux system outer membrane protein